jgi:hypothetical protein
MSSRTASPVAVMREPFLTEGLPIRYWLLKQPLRQGTELAHHEMTNPPKFVWTGDLNDDCFATWENISLHAERIDKKFWWWAVYGTREKLDSWTITGRYATGKAARKAAENAARLIRDNETASGTELAGLVLIEGKIRLATFTKDGQYEFVDKFDNPHLLLYGQSFGSAVFRTAIEELEHLVNDPRTKELTLQDFFARYPDFILNDDYKAAHPHVILGGLENESLIPDFVLEPVSQGAFCDLLELKLPKAKVFTLKKNRTRFSSAVLDACAQLREYSNHFESQINRSRIKRQYGLNIYKPRMIVIIGRKGNFDPLIVRRAAGDFPHLQLKTYDEIIERIRHRYA